MPVPRCPVCGSEAVDSSQQDTHSVSQTMNESSAKIVICHCSEKHRFVASLKERALAAGGFDSEPFSATRGTAVRSA